MFPDRRGVPSDERGKSRRAATNTHDLMRYYDQNDVDVYDLAGPLPNDTMFLKLRAAP